MKNGKETHANQFYIKYIPHKPSSFSALHAYRGRRGLGGGLACPSDGRSVAVVASPRNRWRHCRPLHTGVLVNIGQCYATASCLLWAPILTRLDRPRLERPRLNLSECLWFSIPLKLPTSIYGALVRNTLIYIDKEN